MLVALIQDGAVIRRIHHLGLPDVVPEMRPPRAQAISEA